MSDDKTNGWASVVNEADGSNGQQGIWMAQGITAGARYITFSFSGSGVQYFNCDISEFYNVATSGGADATGVNVVSSTAITTAANVSPSTSGDLIYLAALFVEPGAAAAARLPTLWEARATSPGSSPQARRTAPTVAWSSMGNTRHQRPSSPR